MLDNHYVPEGYGILPFINIFGFNVPTYSLFVGLGLIVGMLWFLITVPSKSKVNYENTFLIVLSALFFGWLGAKVLAVVENLPLIIDDFSKLKYFVFSGKSIVGGLIGGYFGVRFIKKRLNLNNVRTGNKIAPAVALGMAIGRIGCFLTGCCFGIETSLPIGVDFGDGILRIPTQLIEIVFCFGLFCYLLYKQKKEKDLIPGILFKELVLLYFVFRFFIEFIRGTSKNILFLSVYQVICILGFIFIFNKIKKEKELHKNHNLSC